MARTDAARGNSPETDGSARDAAPGLVRRVWERDTSLWASGSARDAVARRLGWLDAPEHAVPGLADLERWARGIRSAGFTDAALLGMGGSSLCPEVLRRTFPEARDGLSLTVLDTTDPRTVRAAAERLPLERTLFLVSSKSGTTIETLSLYRYFFGEVARRRPGAPGGAFVAITDPGTLLEKEARERGFRDVVAGPEDVGGRYSALTPFGLVPAALLGLDVARLVARARAARQACREETPGNPGLSLAVALAGHARLGRDKLTLVPAAAIAALGLWLEQLVAESLGKNGTGIVPVWGEPVADPSAYGEDRVFVSLAVAGMEATDARALAALERAGLPVLARTLEDLYDLGGEFFVWEFATALAAALLGVNAFDEPNVSESKENTATVLEARGTMDADGGPAARAERGPHVVSVAPEPGGAAGGRARARAWLAALPKGSYLGLQAFLPDDAATERALAALRARLFERTGLSTTSGLGPRYLHSTGQLHKGGPPTGAFLQITCREQPELPIPEAGYDFGTLLMAQAEGDARSLARRGRPLLRVSIASIEDLDELTSWF